MAMMRCPVTGEECRGSCVGAACELAASRELTSLSLEEGERQVVLLALARLSVERPGWHDLLHTLALQIDSQNEGRALTFDQFRALTTAPAEHTGQPVHDEEQHAARHRQLNDALDELVADWIIHTDKRPSSTRVLELMRWSGEQARKPTPTGSR